MGTNVNKPNDEEDNSVFFIISFDFSKSIGFSADKDIKMITDATKTCKAVKISIEEAVEKFVIIMEEFYTL